MTDAENLGKTPSEILDFLRATGGHSLLIKGKAGTGKTTLALQMIEELSGEQVDYYLSTRVSDESLYRQFPWLREKARRNQILKAGKTFLTKSRPRKKEEGEQTHVLRAAKNLLNAFSQSESEPTVVRSELQKLEGQIEAGELGEDEEEDGFPVDYEGGSVVLDFGIMLPELELAYDLTESHLPKRTLVVMDSIEALSEKYGITAARIMNTLQRDLVENSETNLVYVMESWENTQLDYLGDGVIVLESGEVNGRRTREMSIQKLRGSKIERWKYMFTLLDGRLRAFEPVSPRLPKEMDPHYPVKDPSKRTVSSGNESMDQVFGGFPRGEVTLLEIGRDVPQEVIRRVELSLVADFVSKMRGVMWFPMYSMDYSFFNDQMVQMVDEDMIAKSLRVLYRGRYSDRALPFLTMIEGTDASHDLKWNSLKYLLSETSTPYLSLLGYDALESVYGEDVISGTSSHLDAMRRLGNVVVVEATSSSRSLDRLAHQASLHIRLENMAGAVMACGQKPFTNYYYLDFRNGIDPDLVPML
ncbi:MAG: gas vesicle protein GvpD P-loop domain-containing protein [Methanomassiliicoccales archaeon]